MFKLCEDWNLVFNIRSGKFPPVKVCFQTLKPPGFDGYEKGSMHSYDGFPSFVTINLKTVFSPESDRADCERTSEAGELFGEKMAGFGS